jgi:hypothetical protein
MPYAHVRFITIQHLPNRKWQMVTLERHAHLWQHGGQLNVMYLRFDARLASDGMESVG